jgi:hypothetical protein
MPFSSSSSMQKLTASLYFSASCCASKPASPALHADMSAAFTQAFETAFAQLQPRRRHFPQKRRSPRDSRPHAARASVHICRRSVEPAGYAAHLYPDTCQYLHDKWNSNNAAPGTVVMVVMLHGIKKSRRM